MTVMKRRIPSYLRCPATAPAVVLSSRESARAEAGDPEVVAAYSEAARRLAERTGQQVEVYARGSRHDYVLDYAIPPERSEEE